DVVSFLIHLRRQPKSTRFPYTTLFRSRKLNRTAGKRRWNSASSEGRRTAAVVSIDPIASGPFGSPSSRAASSASRDSAAIRCARSEEHTSELQSQSNLVCRLLLEKKNN